MSAVSLELRIKNVPPEKADTLRAQYQVAKDLREIARKNGLPAIVVYAHTTAILEDGFADVDEYLAYHRMKVEFNRRADKHMETVRPAGYEIRSLSSETNLKVLAVKLEETEESVEREALKQDFERHLEYCAKLIQANAKYDVSISAGKVTKKLLITIEPKDLETRAFLDAYKNLLGVEIDE